MFNGVPALLKVPSLVCPEGVLNGPQTIAKHLVKAVKGSLLAPKNTDGPMVCRICKGNKK